MSASIRWAALVVLCIASPTLAQPTASLRGEVVELQYEVTSRSSRLHSIGGRKVVLSEISQAPMERPLNSNARRAPPAWQGAQHVTLSAHPFCR